MIDHHLSPEHERIARQATDPIRAAIAAGVRPLVVPPPEGACEDEDVS